jgi:salicylate hydroxylase
MANAALSIAVIGGGIGGLGAALALHRAGFAVDVYEQAPELTEIGGGINMGPNAARILYRLGLGEGLDREAVRPVGMHQRRWDDGRTLQQAPLNPLCDELYGAPHLTIHRADLLAVIAAGFPAERVHLCHRLVDLADRGAKIEAQFENGRRIAVDVLVGADGIHSTVRALLFGAEEPQFAGCVAYRGLVPSERVADLGLERGNQSWLGPGGHLVHYFVSRGRLLNFVGWTEHDTWNREDWTDRATIARALAAFEGWHPQIRRIIEAADTCFIWALFDRDPLPRWSVGRTTLLGDACHPMYPFMAQGAAQAIEDGATLAACLVADGGRDLAAALRRYEALRLPRVTRLQQMSRANKYRYHMPDGPEQEARDATMAANRERAPETMQWLFGFDAGAIDHA